MKQISIFFLVVIIGLSSCKNKAQEAIKEKRQDEMQNKENRVSPAMVTTRTIGTNQVTINYGSPRVTAPDGKNRDGHIWGELVPYNTVWRTGANEATTITFTKNVMVEGQLLEKDTYSLFTLPNPDEWMWIFNLNEKQWGAFKYNAADDALRVAATPKPIDFLQEEMKFEILEDTIPDMGVVRLTWERLQVEFIFENAEE